jgi:hypothetical protein
MARRLNKKPDWHKLGSSHEDAMSISTRKGPFLVLYLRGRRSGDVLTPYYRKQHFRLKK